MKPILLIFVLFCIACPFVCGIASYEGYKVYEITPHTLSQAHFLLQYEGKSGFDFWLHPKSINSSSTLMVSPKNQNVFENDMTANGLDLKVLIKNVQDTIYAEDAHQLLGGRLRKRSIGQVTFTHYMSYSEMSNYMRRLAESYPDIVTLVNMGKSYEGRDMLLLELSTNRDAKKPVIFIDAGIRPRGWMAPPVALYVIQQLVENPENRHLLDKVDWAISPCINPDGYQFTQTGDRLWKKTRSHRNTSSHCYGVDANKNFDFHWEESGDECLEAYSGPHAFSEVETLHVRDYLLQHNETIKLYLSFHDHGSMILFPWGYTSEFSSDESELRSLAQKVSNAIASVSNSRYSYGSSSQYLISTPGSNIDYVKGVIGIQLAYWIELPSGGNSGFNPPANRILPIVQETFTGIITFHQHIEEQYGLSEVDEEKSIEESSMEKDGDDTEEDKEADETGEKNSEEESEKDGDTEEEKDETDEADDEDEHDETNEEGSDEEEKDETGEEHSEEKNDTEEEKDETDEADDEDEHDETNEEGSDEEEIGETKEKQSEEKDETNEADDKYEHDETNEEGSDGEETEEEHSDEKDDTEEEKDETNEEDDEDENDETNEEDSDEEEKDETGEEHSEEKGDTDEENDNDKTNEAGDEDEHDETNEEDSDGDDKDNTEEDEETGEVSDEE